MWRTLGVIGHVYRLLVLLLTLIVNGVLLLLIARHRWARRVLEMLLIVLILTMDILFAVAYLVRYWRSFWDHPSSLMNNGVSKMMTENATLCTMSGTFLSLATNLSITWIALLGYMRYTKIVRHLEYQQWVWIVAVVLLSLPVMIFSLLGSYFHLYVIIPGSFSCQIWSPTRNDPWRTPIQIYFSLNLGVCLVTAIICYTCISFHQHRALEAILHPECGMVLPESPLQRPASVYSDPKEEPLTPTFSFLNSSFNRPTKQEVDIQYQQNLVRYRITYVVLAYLFCHLPECLIGIGEIISGFTRSKILSAIAFQPRFMFALINPTVILAMHAHTRQALFSLVRNISSKIFD